jgi:hypothetical protein
VQKFLAKALLTCAPFVIACATAPTQQLVESQSAASAAEAAGAEQYPHSAYYLELANEQITSAKQVMDSDEERARALLMRAESDARLAHAYARTEEMKARAQRAREEVQSLQQQQNQPNQPDQMRPRDESEPMEPIVEPIDEPMEEPQSPEMPEMEDLEGR